MSLRDGRIFGVHEFNTTSDGRIKIDDGVVDRLVTGHGEQGDLILVVESGVERTIGAATDRPIEFFVGGKKYIWRRNVPANRVVR